MIFVGADGCRAGWFAVSLTEAGDWTVNVFADVASLWAAFSNASVILLDVPIGLREDGPTERLCDREARRLLGPGRQSSVFPVPCRPAIYCTTYQQASQVNKEMTGRGLSVQTWSIIPKIREVDALLTSDRSARSRIREVHPEICFWSLAGGRPMENRKKTREGFAERVRALRSTCPYTDDIIDYALSTYRRRDVAKDDVLDALSAAVTATVGMDSLASIPAAPEVDGCALPMQMVYRPGSLDCGFAPLDALA